MEYSASPPCGAPSCSEPALWRYAAAVPTEGAAAALARPDAELRCQLHMSLSALTWLPGLADGLVVVVGTVDSPASTGRHAADTVRMETHLIDVDQLRPRRPSVTGDATQFMPALSGLELAARLADSSQPGNYGLTDPYDELS